METFVSEFEKLGVIPFPVYSGTRVMMMPIVLGDSSTIPESLGHYQETIEAMWIHRPEYYGQVGYVTIDEKVIETGSTHRREGLHVDGVYHGKAGGWGGGPGSWGGGSSGMIIASTPPGCVAWQQEFEGEPGPEGECDHLIDQCEEGHLLENSTAYWCGGLCVHESLPQEQDIKRQFIRLSLPSDGPWFEGYTENPLGIKPIGEILPRRSFMDE